MVRPQLEVILSTEAHKGVIKVMAILQIADTVASILVATGSFVYTLYRLYKWLKGNWIRWHQIRHWLKTPMLPDWMMPLVTNFKSGIRVSKDLILGTPSTQFWNGLLPSQQEQTLQLIDWLGKSRYDFLDNIKRHQPKGGDFPIHWKR